MAAFSAEPPAGSERDPSVPAPFSIAAVSPWITVTSSLSMPNASVISWE